MTVVKVNMRRGRVVLAKRAVPVISRSLLGTVSGAQGEDNPLVVDFSGRSRLCGRPGQQSTRSLLSVDRCLIHQNIDARN